MATAATQLDLGEMYEPEAVAVALKVSKGVVYRLIHRKELFALKIGSQFRIPGYAIRDYLGIADATSGQLVPAEAA